LESGLQSWNIATSTDDTLRRVPLVAPDDMSASPDNPKPSSSRATIPRSVWALGVVSLFMDISSEMIHSLLPVFLVVVLGATATAVGILEGVAEGAIYVTKLISGRLSDRLGKRKGLVLAGYGLAALTKPLFPLAHSYAVVFAARLIDRIGKGVRGAPRDAFVADLVPLSLRGASYGLRQSLDSVGAVTGPLLATLLMITSGGQVRLVFWIAVLPAFLSVAVLIWFVHERGDTAPSPQVRFRIDWEELRRFPRAFWSVVGIGAIFTLARFSEAFLVLRAQDLGVSIDYVPLVLVLMNGVYALSAYPAGRLSDRVNRRVVLATGAAVLVIADLMLAAGGGLTALMIGIALWGLHLGLSQGLLVALIADTAPRERRGTAFGLFNIVSGIVLLMASVLAGALWDRIGPSVAFYAGAGFAGVTVMGLLLGLRKK
jgi:MFS family permease